MKTSQKVLINGKILKTLTETITIENLKPTTTLIYFIESTMTKVSSNLKIFVDALLNLQHTMKANDQTNLEVVFNFIQIC